MRHFHSYGPVDCESHFCVKRQELIAQGVQQLIGQPEEKGGHSAVGGRCVVSPEFPT